VKQRTAAVSKISRRNVVSNCPRLKDGVAFCGWSPTQPRSYQIMTFGLPPMATERRVCGNV
jgi:hypothetical protein